MAFEWVRLDSNLPTHDKILRLTAASKHRAAFVYVCSMAYSGGHGTNGRIDPWALQAIHARSQDAADLVAVGLWTPDGDGWQIHNWEKRQRKNTTGKANCVRWHGPDCGCWKEPK